MSGWIMSLFGGSLALLVYASLFVSGLMFFLFSVLVGGDADSDIDVDGHDGDLDHGHDGDGDHEGHGPSVLSVRGIFLMMTGYGGVGFIAQHYSGKILFSSVVGIVSGWALAALIMFVMRLAYQQQSDSGIQARDIIGAYGMVTLTIPGKGKFGEVSISASGNQMNRPAVSEDGKMIANGTRIRVVHSQAGVVRVEKVS